MNHHCCNLFLGPSHHHNQSYHLRCPTEVKESTSSIQVEASTSRQGGLRVDMEASTSGTHQDEENEEAPPPPSDNEDDMIDSDDETDRERGYNSDDSYGF